MNLLTITSRQWIPLSIAPAGDGTASLETRVTYEHHPGILAEIVTRSLGIGYASWIATLYHCWEKSNTCRSFQTMQVY